MIQTSDENCGLSFTFDGYTPRAKEFIEEIKRRIPVKTGYVYFKKEQRWWISGSYLEIFREMYERYFTNTKQLRLI